MVLSPVTMVIKNLGMHTVVNMISKQEKLQRKKYIGVLRRGSSRVRRIMIQFPIRLKVYLRNRNIKITTCTGGSSVNPKRMNSIAFD
jgi:hypothetical protein